MSKHRKQEIVSGASGDAAPKLLVLVKALPVFQCPGAAVTN